MSLRFWLGRLVGTWEVDEEKKVCENAGEMAGSVLVILKLEWPWAVKWGCLVRG